MPKKTAKSMVGNSIAPSLCVRCPDTVLDAASRRAVLLRPRAYPGADEGRPYIRLREPVKTHSVVVTFGLSDEMRDAVREALGREAEPVFLKDVGGKARRNALASTDAILAWNPWRELEPDEVALIGRAPFMQLTSAGADHIRFEDLPSSLTVASNVGAFAEPMAEHAVAMILTLAKRLNRTNAELARGEFDQRTRTIRVEGSVCGILGFGGIGKATGRLMTALGARIHAVNTTGRTDQEVEFVGTLDDLAAVVAACDFLVIALPLTRTTKGLIGRRELAAMKPTAILVNVARGAIVDEEALFEHLRTHQDFKAGLDAWWDEPRGKTRFSTRFPFFELPNVIGSPHNSALVPGIELHAVRRAAENVARHLRGEPVMGIVRREDYEV
jgi:phosphoglycerate dehydrogenase-like enzyme